MGELHLRLKIATGYRKTLLVLCALSGGGKQKLMEFGEEWNT
jgi:hypothetical protein